MQDKIQKLVALPSQCEDLLTLGMMGQPALFWYSREESLAEPNNADGSPKLVWQVGMMPFATVDDISEDMVPAWTKPELDAMIGNQWPKPDLFTDKEFQNARAIERESYPVFYPDNMRIYRIGAAASADVLAFLIRANKINVQEALERHKKIFL